MFKKLVIVCGITLLFLTACGSEEDSAKPAAEDEEASPTAVATVEPTEEARSGGYLGDSFQPLSLLAGPMFGGGFGGGDFDMEASGQEVSPDLKAALLTDDDLPPGYSNSPDGDYAFSLDMPEGHMEMAMRMFFEGDMMSDEFDSVVMPAAMSLPPDTMEDFDASLDELEEMDFSDDEVQDLMGDSDMWSVEFKEFEVFEAPGLGEVGFGMHMVMEMDASAFGADPGAGMEAFEGGLAYDIYMFTRGDRVFMLMVMWPADRPAPVDALALAEIMDARAQ